MIHRTTYRVIYGDTDQMGVVYYANYLRWFETGRSELLREIGVPYLQIEQQGIHFPVAEVSCRYAQSGYYDDVIEIETQVAEIGRASVIFTYRIVRKADRALLATGFTKHACIDNRGRVSRLPPALTDALKAGQSREQTSEARDQRGRKGRMADS